MDGQAFAVRQTVDRADLGQVRGYEGPWLPEVVSGDEPPAGPDADRDSVSAGIGGMAPVLAEIGQYRALAGIEHTLAAAIVMRLCACCLPGVELSLYYGLGGDLLRDAAQDCDDQARADRLLNGAVTMADAGFCACEAGSCLLRPRWQGPAAPICPGRGFWLLLGGGDADAGQISFRLALSIRSSPGNDSRALNQVPHTY
jgi:hypothetical protein